MAQPVRSCTIMYEAGDILEVSAPRGTFTLQPGDESCGPGERRHRGHSRTRDAASLPRRLSLASSSRKVWWLYGARNRAEHPFAKESRELLHTLAARPKPHCLQPARAG